MKKIRNLKLVVMLEYQSIKTFSQKFKIQIGLKIFLWLKKVGNTVLRIYAINDLHDEEIVRTFYGKKTNQKELRIEKVIKRKGDRLYVKWKIYNNSFDT